MLIVPWLCCRPWHLWLCYHRNSQLYYFYGRGLGEAVRFALGGAGADWEDRFVRKRSDMVKLLEERDPVTGAKALMFDQLPLLVMPDGTKVVQSAAILRHVGRTFGMYGDSDAERTRIDELLGGISDLGDKCPGWPAPDAIAGLDAKIAQLTSKWLPRYAGAFEQQLSVPGSSGFLVGSRISIADTTLLRYTEEISDWVGEVKTAQMLAPWPKLTTWRTRMKGDLKVTAFLASSHRLPSPAVQTVGAAYYSEVMTSLGWS